jgi:hypothetical protein
MQERKRTPARPSRRAAVEQIDAGMEGQPPREDEEQPSAAEDRSTRKAPGSPPRNRRMSDTETIEMIREDALPGHEK